MGPDRDGNEGGLKMVTGPAPKISVICAWYNRADYIRDTINCLLGQDHDSFEIVVVNDGSKDPRVREILDSYTDPRLRVIHQENRGMTVAMHNAILASSGEYVAIHGAGDTADTARLRIQALVLDQEPELVGCGTAHVNVHVGGPDDGLRKPVANKFEIIGRHELMEEIGCPVNHGDFMFRRSVYDRVGGYRPFFRMGPNWDLLLRMSRHGKVRLCPEMLYERRVFSSDGIASRLDRTLVQARYGLIAKACMLEADRWGADSVDIFGLDAGMFRKGSSFMANRMAKAAVKYMRLGYFEDAAILVDLARREALTPYVAGAMLTLKLTANGTGRRLVRSLASRVPMREQREIRPLLPRGQN